MKPYYDRGGAVLYFGDCRDVIPTLGKDWADMIVTDPPYGQDYESNRRVASEGFGKIEGDESLVVTREGLKLAWPCLRWRRHAYVFGPVGFEEKTASPRVELTWDKCLMSGGDLSMPWGKSSEPIGFQASVRPIESSRQGAPARMRKGTVLRFPRPNGAAIVNHPTEKPVALLRELIESSSRVGETVFDPFIGSGSTAVAALLEGRGCVGIEKSERHIETAARRLDAMFDRYREVEGGLFAEAGR